MSTNIYANIFSALRRELCAVLVPCVVLLWEKEQKDIFIFCCGKYGEKQPTNLSFKWLISMLVVMVM